MKDEQLGAGVDDGPNRRQFTRIAADALPHLTARLVGGPHVRLIDVSRRGAQVETAMPMGPGRPVTIRFVAADTTFTLTGAVVRSSVAVVARHGLTYHTALSFTEDVLLCPEIATPAETSDQVGGSTTDVSAPGEGDDDVMVVAAPGETGSALRLRLLAGSW